MVSFRFSTDNYSGDTPTNTDGTSTSPSSSSFNLTSTPALDQDDTTTSPTFIIGDDEEPPTPLPIYILSRPSDWVRLLGSILFAHGQNSILACLSFLYIIARLPLATWGMYQIYRFSTGSTAKGIAVLVLVFFISVLEKEIGLEKKCWDVLAGMGTVWIREERGRREREVARVRRWEERQQWEREKREQRMRHERDGWDRNGKDEDEDMSLQAWMGERGTLRDDDDRSFYGGGESDTTKLL